MSVISAQMASRLASFRTSDEDKDEKGTTVRPSSTSLFGIDSADRYKDLVSAGTNPTSPYQFTISKNESLLNGFFSRIALTEIIFPYYIPNINNITYQLAAVIDAGAPVVLDLARVGGFGFYTPDALAAAIDAELALNGLAGATVGYREGRFFIDAGAGHTIRFVRASYVGGPRITEFQAIDLLGLNNPQNLTADVRQQTSSVTRCRFTEYIDIVSSQLTYNQDLKDSSSAPVVRDVLARVYIETENDQPIPVIPTGTAAGTNVDNTIPGTYPFTIYRQFKTPKMIKWNKNQPLGNLQFEVYDDRGVLLSPNLLPGAGLGTGSDYNMPDWRFTLLCSEN